MKVVFPDQSYIESTRTDHDTYIITIVAKDQLNNLKNIINSVELTSEQYQELFGSK
mgnify:CR=1 FL=1